MRRNLIGCMPALPLSPSALIPRVFGAGAASGLLTGSEAFSKPFSAAEASAMVGWRGFPGWQGAGAGRSHGEAGVALHAERNQNTLGNANRKGCGIAVFFSSVRILPRVQDHCGGKGWALGCAFFSLFQPSASKIWRDPPTRNVEILALLGRTDIPNTALWGLVFPSVVERQDRFCRLPSVRRWSANSIRDLPVCQDLAFFTSRVLF
jgi:hypothetical protein